MVTELLKKIEVFCDNSFGFSVIECEHVFNSENNTLSEAIGNSQCLVVTSHKIFELYGNDIEGYFKSRYDLNYNLLQIGDSEDDKNFDTISTILKSAKSMGLDRKGIMVAIGGGIIMDMVGFAASMYRRKVDYIRIPTTLIGYVDAGIGIKTGINFSNSKNFIGAFYPPKISINDYSFLNTLDVKEIRNGIAEMIKMGLIVDEKLFSAIEANIFELIQEKCQKNIGKIVIHDSIYDMLIELDKNFYEDCLERLVDFGHTFSPFIEVHSNYAIPHGHAVALDIAISCELSYKLGYLKREERNRVLDTFLKAGMNIYDEETFCPVEMAKSLRDIKLHRGGSLNLVLPVTIGEAIFYKDEISPEVLKGVFLNLKLYQNSFFNKSNTNSLVFDIGGTFIRAAIYNSGTGLQSNILKDKSPNFINCKNREQLLASFKETLKKMSDELCKQNESLQISHVGISFPGPVKDSKEVLNAPTLWGKEITNINIMDILKEIFPTQECHVINDITAAGYRYLNNNRKDFCIITISSGVGCKVFKEGKVVLNQNALGGELGHVYHRGKYEHFECDCGKKGHIGAISSGRGVENIARYLAAQNIEGYENSLLKDSNITTYDIVEAAQKEDKFALYVLRESILPIADAISFISSTMGIDDFVMIGGFFYAVKDLYLKILKEEVVNNGIMNLSNGEIHKMISAGIEDDNNGIIGVGKYISLY